MIEDLTTFSVSSLNKYIKNIFDSNFTLTNISLKGEISNFKKYPSGHCYFSLKDDESTIKAVMFYDFARFLDPKIKDGSEVIAKGRVSVYPSRGEYQIYVESLKLYGEGDILLAFEQLKKKLAAEGLFDQSRKRKINQFPKAVGIISAKNSAAMADMTTNLLRRNPLIEVKLFPSLVQGKDAPKDLLRAVKEAENSNIDTLIIGRGGGASEDLTAFNDEALVRYVASLKIPTISAVGHEIDFTLIDYVSDARASTPTGACELATIDKREIFQLLDYDKSVLSSSLNKYILYLKNKIENIKDKPMFKNPHSIYDEMMNSLIVKKEKLHYLTQFRINILKEKLSNKKNQLESISPKEVLKRGYSILKNKDGKIINSINQIDINDNVNVTLSDGAATLKVIEKEK